MTIGRFALLSFLIATTVIGPSTARTRASDANDQPPAVVMRESATAKTSPNAEPTLGVDWVIDRVHRTLHVAHDPTYRIDNAFGDIRLRGTEEDELMVFAACQFSTTDSIRPLVDLTESEDEVIIDVRFRDETEGAPDLEPGEVGRRRVDLVVVLPGNGSVAVDARDGFVEAKGVAGPLTVATHSGSQRLVARNSLDLSSVHGDVDVFFKGIGELPPLAVETLTGDIRVELPRGVDRTIRAKTNGLLTTDFTMVVEKPAGSPHKIAYVHLGKGGELIRLTSNRGAISILDQPSLAETTAQ